MLLKDCIVIKNGKDYSHLKNGDIPVFGTGGILTHVNDCLYDAEALLLPRKGSLNNVMYIDKKKFWTVDTMFYAISKIDDINLKYLYYYLTLIHIKKLDIGSTIPSMTSGLYYQINVDIPEKEKQDKVVKILSSIDAQIERNKAIIQKIQDLGNTIYSKEFKTCYNTCALTDFPYISILKPGINEFDGEKHYIATGDVNDTELNFNASCITFEKRENRANMQPIKNSIWFAKMKNSNKHIYVSANDDVLVDQYIFSTGFCGLKCEDFVYEFMVGFLNLPYFEQIKNQLAHGATMEAINNENLSSIKIPLPEKNDLIKYHNKVKDIYKQISAIKIENHKLTLLRNKLLPLLINGQLSV